MCRVTSALVGVIWVTADRLPFAGAEGTKVKASPSTSVPVSRISRGASSFVETACPFATGASLTSLMSTVIDAGTSKVPSETCMYVGQRRRCLCVERSRIFHGNFTGHRGQLRKRTLQLRQRPQEKVSVSGGTSSSVAVTVPTNVPAGEFSSTENGPCLIRTPAGCRSAH